MNDYLLDCDFLVFDVPDDMPDDPYSEDGLRVAEAEMLRRFTGTDDALAPANRGMFDKFVRFVGATFVNSLGFQWTNKPAGYDAGNAYIAVEMPSIDTQLSVPSLVTSAAKRRTGGEWAFVFRNMAARLQEHADTVAGHASLIALSTQQPQAAKGVPVLILTRYAGSGELAWDGRTGIADDYIDDYLGVLTGDRVVPALAHSWALVGDSSGAGRRAATGDLVICIPAGTIGVVADSTGPVSAIDVATAAGLIHCARWALVDSTATP